MYPYFLKKRIFWLGFILNMKKENNQVFIN